jgi:histidyl-tRNA synthetase
VFTLVQQLRSELLLEVDLDLAGRTPKGQLKQADRSGALRAVLVGLEWLDPGTARVRDLRNGDEDDVALDALADWFAAANDTAEGAP